MQSVKSDELLSNLELQVEKHLASAVRAFQNLSEPDLNQKPPDGGWSIAQCLEHLNTYGDYYLPRIEKAMEKFNGKPSSEFSSTWLGNYFTKMMDPVTGKRKMKAFAAHVPPSALDGHAVTGKFIQQQETLLQLLRSAKQKDLNKIKIPISISRFIRMKLGDTFRFIIAHNERHVEQAKRLLI
jgi:uncharacterized damage-inducible protein DinB